MGPRSENEYFASIGQVIRDVDTFAKNPATHSSTEYVITDSKMQVLQDSIFFLDTANMHIHMMGGGFSIFGIPYRASDVIHIKNDGSYVIARPGSGEINFYDNHFGLKSSINLETVERKVSNSDIDYALKSVREDVQQDVRAKIAPVKPPFLNLWLTDSHIFMHTDNTEDGKEIVVLEIDGSPVGKFVVSNIDNIKYFDKNLIYVLSKDPEMGDMIRVYEWSL